MITPSAATPGAAGAAGAPRKDAAMVTEPSPAFGELVRRYRFAAELTQEQLAERAGISARVISEIERGGPHVPRRDTVALLAEALGLSATERKAFVAAARPAGAVASLPALTLVPPPTTLPAAPFVFVASARADSAFADRLLADLQARGITCWTDRQGLKPGEPDWEQAVRDAIRACQGLLLVASRDSRQSRYVKAELAVAEMYGRPVYPLWAAGEEWIDCIPLSLSTAQYVDARGERYAAALAESVAVLGCADAVAGVMAVPAEAEPTAAPRNPYKGLSAFTEEDAGDFFGRTGVVDDLLEALREALTPGTAGSARLLTVVGPSGSGKSSVVMAGLLPRLKDGALLGSDTWVYLAPLVPGHHPVEALATTLAGQADARMRAMRDDLDTDSSRGLHLLAGRLVPRPQARVVLLIDQFEELFTQTADAAERQRFIDLLVAAVTEPRGPVLVILTVRADFFHQTMRSAELWQLVETHTHYITPMAPDDLRAVIEQPARLADTRLTFEGDLVGDLLFELRGQEGALPLLQFTLDQLFQRREGHCLTMGAYGELGGVRGALAKHAEATYTSLPSAEHRTLARALFLRLIEPGASEQDLTRRRVTMTELALPDPRQTTILREAAAAFITARLLITNAVSGTSTLEVSHETLIRAWPRLSQWVQEDRAGLIVHRRLTEASMEWQRERDEGVLYRGARLAAALEWVQRTDSGALNEGEHAFLEASVALKVREEDEEQERQQRQLAAALALAQSERRRARVARSLSGVLAIVLIGALVAAFLAVQQRHQAQIERDAALHAKNDVIKQQTIMRSHDLAASALAQLRNDPELSVLLAAAAARFAPTDQAVDALRQALAASPVRAVMRGHAEAVNSAVFSADGTLVLTASQDNTAALWQTHTGKLLHTLRGHGDFVNSAVFSPDGTLVLTAGADGTARIWQTRSGQPLYVLRGHTASVNSATFSADGALIVTASQDNTAAVWQAHTGKLLRILRGHTYPVVRAVFSPDGTLIATASQDYTAAVWQARTGQLLHILRGHTAAVNTVAFSPDGTLLVTACGDNTARIWQARTGRLLHTLQGHTASVNDAVFSPDGTLLATAGDDTTARVWQVGTGQQVTILRGHTAAVNTVAFSPDGSLVATASADHSARVWQPRTGVLVEILHGHGDTVTSAAFSPDGARVVTASGDGTARVWMAHPGLLLDVLRGHGAAVYDAGFSPNGTLIVTASADHSARVWLSHTGKLVTILRGHSDAVNSVAFSPDGGLIVTASADHTARVWQSRSGRLVAILRGHTDAVYDAAFNLDGTLVVTASQDHTARVWQVRTGRLVALLHGHGGAVTSAAFSPDGSLVITTGWDTTARTWRARTGQLVHILRGHTNPVVDAAFSPDGTYIVTASGDHTARVWLARTGKLVTILRGHGDAVNSAAFSPDGTLIVTASADHTARVWQARTGRLVAILRGHTDTVNGALFSPDGALVVTNGADHTTRVWQARTGKPVTILRGHSDTVTSAAFSPDGTLVVTSSGDDTAQIYACDVCGSTHDLLTLALARVTRHLTPEERATYLYQPQSR